jgi:membrane-bound lytic murein transglycosylase B
MPESQRVSAIRPGSEGWWMMAIDRRSILAGAAVAALPIAAHGASFTDFLAAIAGEAQAAGVSAATVRRELAGLEPDAAVIAQSRKQSEFTRPFWDYIEGAVSAARLKQSVPAAFRGAQAFKFIERRLGVERHVVAGIWGMESNFGAATGDKDVLRSVASLAFSGYRDDFYRNETIAALRILEDGHIGRERMLGSWAGAMGQTQFIPSSFLTYAFDADGDGAKNIWTSIPDALASAANHLKLDGWIAGLPWGFEVLVSDGFDFAYGDRMTRHAFADLARAGLARPSGEAMPGSGAGSLFLPTGIRGPAFVITDNFEVIRKYNTSDAYALAVGLLGDRMFGAGPLAGRWPRTEKQLGAKELAELQRSLKAMGLPISKIDGKLGWQTRQGVQAVQRKLGEIPDGHPTARFMAALRRL